MDLVLPDQVSDGRSGNQNLHGEDPTASVGPRKKGLGENPLQHQGELGPNLPLLGRGEDIDNPVDGLRGAVGVQRGEGEMAGFGDPESGLHGLQIPHLSDEHNVGVFTESGPQCC